MEIQVENHRFSINNLIIYKMKEMIKKCQQYFKNKLLAGEFEVIEITENYVNVVIDSEYPFSIWVGNMFDYPHTVKTWELGRNLITLDFTKEDGLQLCSIIKPQVLQYRKNTLIAQKQAELEKLISETE